MYRVPQVRHGHVIVGHFMGAVQRLLGTPLTGVIPYVLTCASGLFEFVWIPES